MNQRAAPGLLALTAAIRNDRYPLLAAGASADVGPPVPDREAAGELHVSGRCVDVGAPPGADYAFLKMFQRTR